MQIPKISNYNSFKGLNVHNDAYKILMPQSEMFIHDSHEMDVFFAKMDACKKNESADIIVNKNASVFLKNNKTGKTTQVFSVYKPHIAYCNLYIALAKAAMIDECYKQGLNPDDYIND